MFLRLGVFEPVNKMAPFYSQVLRALAVGFFGCGCAGPGISWFGQRKRTASTVRVTAPKSSSTRPDSTYGRERFSMWQKRA
jgi:hypothetical protein